MRNLVEGIDQAETEERLRREVENADTIAANRAKEVGAEDAPGRRPLPATQRKSPSFPRWRGRARQKQLATLASSWSMELVKKRAIQRPLTVSWFRPCFKPLSRVLSHAQERERERDGWREVLLYRCILDRGQSAGSATLKRLSLPPPSSSPITAAMHQQDPLSPLLTLTAEISCEPPRSCPTRSAG